MKRSYSRTAQELRPVQLSPNVNAYAEGSVQVEFGNTKVLCTASVENSAPPFQQEKEEGWVTAEYSMLPRSTHTRSRRERGKVGGRTMEIQRLIGRSLRSVVNLKKLNGFAITVDCDVLQADGGTRTASITGGFVALSLACQKLVSEGKIPESPVEDHVAAVSLGILDGKVALDLDYEEDFAADVDLNLVMTGKGDLVEVQGTAEGVPFSRTQLDEMIESGSRGISRLVELQAEALK